MPRSAHALLSRNFVPILWIVGRLNFLQEEFGAAPPSPFYLFVHSNNGDNKKISGNCETTFIFKVSVGAKRIGAAFSLDEEADMESRLCHLWLQSLKVEATAR